MKTIKLLSRKILEHTNEKIVYMSKQQVAKCSLNSSKQMSETQINEIFALSKGRKNASK